MTEIVHARPERFFADRFNVTPSLIDRLLGTALRGRVDDADVYLEYRINEELVIEESTIKKASRHVSQGAGVRAQAGTRTGYAHTDDISITNLEEAARQARAIAADARGSAVVAVPNGRPHDLYGLSETPVAADLARQLVPLAPAGRAFSSTRRSATASRAISIARACRPSPAVSGRRSPRSSSRWSTTERSRTAAAR